MSRRCRSSLSIAKRRLKRSEISTGESTLVRAAASSSASGIPSRRLQIAETEVGAGDRCSNPESISRARSMKRFSASPAVPPGKPTGRPSRGNRTSLEAARGRRLVARIVSPGTPDSSVSAALATDERTCSQLSSTSRAVRACSAATMPATPSSDDTSATPTPAAIAVPTRPGSPTRARSTSQTPSENLAVSEFATSTASLVLPTPPGPITVTNR